jgi:hypothetical protein
MGVACQERRHEEDVAQRISMVVSENTPASYSWDSWIITAKFGPDADLVAAGFEAHERFSKAACIP